MPMSNFIEYSNNYSKTGIQKLEVYGNMTGMNEL